jgi:hypothetical protein
MLQPHEKDLGAVRPFAGDRTAAERMEGALKPREAEAKERTLASAGRARTVPIIPILLTGRRATFEEWPSRTSANTASVASVRLP